MEQHDCSTCEISVIEDDSDIRSALQYFLESEGYRVRAFEDGRAALDGLLAEPKTCLILLDLMMPVMSGWEFLKARQRHGSPLVDVPVVVVSAVADQVSGDPSVRDCVKKPVDLDVLLNCVRKHCGKF